MSRPPDVAILSAHRVLESRRFPPDEAWTDLLDAAEELQARLEAVRAALNHPDVRCLCGHESSLHAVDGDRRCTETADRASWHCPCRTFHPTSIPTPLLVAALSAAPQPEPDECPACGRDRTKADVTCHRTPADGWVCERALEVRRQRE